MLCLGCRGLSWSVGSLVGVGLRPGLSFGSVGGLVVGGGGVSFAGSFGEFTDILVF